MHSGLSGTAMSCGGRNRWLARPLCLRVHPGALNIALAQVNKCTAPPSSDERHCTGAADVISDPHSGCTVGLRVGEVGFALVDERVHALLLVLLLTHHSHARAPCT